MIHIDELDFLVNAVEIFKQHPELYTHMNEDETLIALKYETDVEVYRVNSKVGYFAGVRKNEGEK